jgi:chemotaxis regulatin CheY-phosphate phosphatase CheZ
MTELLLNESEYIAIEDAIAATAKGRAFLRKRDGISRVVGVDTVGQMVRGLKDWIAGAEEGHDRESLKLIHDQLTDLRTHIDRAKAEISDLVETDPAAKDSGHIKGATAELDEIVNSTAQATNDILSAAEGINDLAGQLPKDIPAASTIVDRCMDIFQACSFQDITGQRIAKVVRMLAYVEERVNAMIRVGGLVISDGEQKKAASTLNPGSPASITGEERALLNGPQLPGSGLGQEAIDALLGGSSPAVTPPVESAPKAAAPAAPVVPVAIVAAAGSAALQQSAIDAMFN